MTKAEIKFNKLVAIFMGWTCKTRKSYTDNILVLYRPDGSIFKYRGIKYLLNKTPWNAPLKFHSDWNWIMTVITKICIIIESNEEEDWVSDHYQIFSNINFFTDTKYTFIDCIETFILEYNSNNTIFNH